MTRKTVALTVVTIVIGLGVLGYLAVTRGAALVWPMVERLMFGALEQVKPSDASNALLAEINAYRANAATLPPARAASEWVALWDRTQKAAVSPDISGEPAFDKVTGFSVDLRSVIAALPPPTAWAVWPASVPARPADFLMGT